MDFSKLSPSDWIAFWSILVTLFTSLVAICISLASLIQNRNIIRNLNAPKLFFYANQITTGFYSKYIVLRNYGNTETKIIDISFQGELHELDQKFVTSLKGATILPGETISNGIIDDGEFGDSNVTISVTYTRYKKKVTETFLLDFNRLNNTFYIRNGNRSQNKDSTVRALENLNVDMKNIAHTFDKKNL